MERKRFWKRVLSSVLALAMVVTSLTIPPREAKAAANVYDVSQVGAGISKGSSITTTVANSPIKGTKELQYGDEIIFKYLPTGGRTGIGYGSYGVYFYGTGSISYCNKLSTASDLGRGKDSVLVTLDSAITTLTKMKIKIEEQSDDNIKITLTIYASDGDENGRVYEIPNVPKNESADETKYFCAVDTNYEFTLASALESETYDISDMKAGIAPGGLLNATAGTRITGTKELSYGDEVTFKLTIDGDARHAIGYGSYGVYFKENTSLMYCNDLTGALNFGRSNADITEFPEVASGTAVRMKVKIEEQDTSYVKITLTVYANDEDETGTAYTISDVPRQATEAPLYFNAVNSNAPFTLASTVEATYNEMCFGHWSESLGTSTYEAAPIYGLPEGTISSLDGVAISGKVSFPNTGARLRIGGKAELNHGGFWLWNDGGLWLSPQGIGGDGAGYHAISGDTWSAIKDTTFLLRLTFDDVGTGWAVGIYVNNTYIQTLTYKDASTALEPGLILGIEEGVTVDMSIPGQESSHETLTFTNWGISNGTYINTMPTELSDGTTSLDGYAFEGIVNFNGRTDNIIRIGGNSSNIYVALQIYFTNANTLCLYSWFDNTYQNYSITNGSYNSKIKIRLTFDETAENEWKIGVRINDVDMQDMRLTNTNLGTGLFVMRNGNDQTTEPGTTVQSVSETNEYNITDVYDQVKWSGRNELLDIGVAMDQVASGFEFKVEAEGEVKVTADVTGDTYFTVYIDGVRQEKRGCITPTEKTMTVASFATSEEHVIRVVKQTEAQFSLCTLKALEFQGSLKDKPEEKPLYLEFIGDSITCGFGNLTDKSNTEAGTALYEDGTQAFPFVTAEKLAADVSVVGCSGIGASKAFTTFLEKDYYAASSYYRDPSTAYDFERVPDCVIINLGTNDVANGASKSEFKAAVKALVEQIRGIKGYNTNVPIVWTDGLMLAQVETWVTEAFTELGGADAGLYVVTFQSDLNGGGTHPTLAGHEAAATVLAKFIPTVMDSNITVYDFNGRDFDTSLTADEQSNGGTGLNAAYLASLLTDTSSVPGKFEDGVYAGKSSSGCVSVPVAFTETISRTKVESIKVRMWLGEEASATTSEFRIGADKNLKGYSGVTYASTGGVCGQWCDVDITNALVSNTDLWDASGNLQRFVLAIRVKYASASATYAMAYFDNITIEWKKEEKPFEYKTLTFKDWNIKDGAYNANTFYSLKDTTIKSLDGYALEGFLNQNEYLGASEIRLGGNNSSTAAMYVTLGIQVSGKKGFQLVNWHDGSITKFEPDGWSIDKDMFVRFTFDETATNTWKIGVHVDGMYLGDAQVKASLSTGLLFMDTNMTLKDSGVQPIYKKVAFTELDTESCYNAAKGEWALYPLSTVPSLIPGKVDTTNFNVTYVLEEPSGNTTTYEGTLTRVKDEKGLCLNVSQAQLPSDANGYAITIKEGEYAANDDSIGICILEDYTICLLDGTLDTDYDFNNPQFTVDVYCDLNEGSYVVGDADTVTIDGVNYSKGDSYDKAGVHTLTYTLYNRTYSREVILYSMCDANEDNKVSVQDLVAMKKYASDNAEPTKAEQMASDITEDGVIAGTDVDIMRQYLVQEDGLLVLTPMAGMETAKAGDAVAALIENYVPGKSDSIKTGEDIYHRKATTLKWISYENVSSYTVVVGTKEDLSDGITYVTADCTLEVMNLLADTDYYWTVSAGSYTSPIATFHTEDTVRTLTIEGITNTRDGGGWDTVDGGKIKQGMYYRGGQLEKSNDVTGITEEGKQFMLNQLGIKADLDLRGDQGGSALGQTVKYLPYSAPYYWGGNTGIGPDMEEHYRVALANAVRSFANADNYPMYVHCSLGRDRTGTVCFLINALCGVSEQNLYLDYELSMLASCTKVDDYATTFVDHNFTGLYNGILGYATSAGKTGCTIQEAVEYYLINRLGITQSEIANIRNLLVEYDAAS